MRVKSGILICGILFVTGLLFVPFIPSNAAVQPTTAPLYTAAFTPEAYVLIDMYELTENGNMLSVPIRCTSSSTKWGCTAFCNNAFNACRPNGVNLPLKNYGSYANSNSSRITVHIEGRYLPDVIVQEIQPTVPNQALQAQAVAARSFLHYSIENGAATATPQPGTPTNTPGPGIPTATPRVIGTPYNNSTLNQAFIPYKFTTLNLTATPNSPSNLCASTNLNALQSHVCAQVTPQYYISLYGYDLPAQARFSSDVVGQTNPGGKPYLISVPDPISNSCDATSPSHGVGLSQNGAVRWATGNQCAGAGNQPWSVSWSTSQQILFHYFTGVELFSMAAGHPRQSAVLRWNPLNLTGLQKQLRYGQYMELTIPVQNTGVSTWTCAGGIDYRLGYKWSYSGSSWTATTSVCGLAPGATRTVTMRVNTTSLPNADNTWSLSISMAEIESGTPYWFHNSTPSWPAYTIGTQIRVCGIASTLCGFGYIPMMVGDGPAFNNPSPAP